MEVIETVVSVIHSPPIYVFTTLQKQFFQSVYVLATLNSSLKLIRNYTVSQGRLRHLFQIFYIKHLFDCDPYTEYSLMNSSSWMAKATLPLMACCNIFLSVQEAQKWVHVLYLLQNTVVMWNRKISEDAALSSHLFSCCWPKAASCLELCHCSGLTRRISRAVRR